MCKVKICGLTRVEDIDAVNYSKPDYIGFVFAPSRRRVSIETASALKAKLDPQIKTVGVFVNEAIEIVAEIHKNGIIDIAQLHGDEDCVYIQHLKNACDCPIIKSISVEANCIVPTYDSDSNAPDYLLFDTPSAQRGGTGKTFDWRILEGYNSLPYFLAGGLSASTVADAIRLLAPYGVDVSSGVETNGVKDAAKIDEFIWAVRAVANK